MTFRAGREKIAAVALFAAVLLALAGCESGPSMEQLAPKMPKLRADVPDSRHPDSLVSEYPNINIAPDRPSVLRSQEELQTIENSLEKEGQSHVRQAVGRITGDIAEEDIEEGEIDASVSSPATTTDKPIDLTPSD